MPTVEIINEHVESHLIGTTTVTNPIVFLEINGQPVVGTKLIQNIGKSKRTIFTKVVGSSIYLVAHSIVYGNDLPSINVTVKVRIAE